MSAPNFSTGATATHAIFAAQDKYIRLVMLKKKPMAPRQVETGEWLWNGQYFDHYPGEELEEYEGQLDEYWERKFDEMRDEGKI